MPEFKVEDFKVNTMMLKTNNLINVDISLVDIVKEALIGFLYDMGDVDTGVTEEHYYSLVRDRYYDSEGERRTLSNEQDNINFIKSEHDVFTEALETVGSLLSDVVDDNFDQIKEFFNVDVTDIFYTPFRAKANDYLMLVIVSRR